MRLISLAMAILVLAAAPADAAWKRILYKDIGIGADFPADPAMSHGQYKAYVAGTNDTVVYSLQQDGIVYKLTAVDFSKRANEGAVLLEEAAYLATTAGKVVVETTARTETRADAIYGRRVTVDLAKGGRTTSVLYFTKGRLFMVEATVLAGGDPQATEINRFTQSVTFNMTGVYPD